MTMYQIIITILVATLLACWLWAGSVYVLAAWEEYRLSRTMRKMNKVVEDYVKAYIAANCPNKEVK